MESAQLDMQSEVEHVIDVEGETGVPETVKEVVTDGQVPLDVKGLGLNEPVERVLKEEVLMEEVLKEEVLKEEVLKEEVQAKPKRKHRKKAHRDHRDHKGATGEGGRQRPRLVVEFHQGKFAYLNLPSSVAPSSYETRVTVEEEKYQEQLREFYFEFMSTRKMKMVMALNVLLSALAAAITFFAFKFLLP